MPSTSPKNKNLKIAFVAAYRIFPATFIINQVADLIDKGIEVEIFWFRKGKSKAVSEKYYRYKINKLGHNLEMPRNWFLRIILAIPKIFHILFSKPALLLKIFNFKRYKKNALSLKLLFWVEPWIGKENEFDLIHCHFGPIANKFLIIKEILGIKTKIITTFYGYDVSLKFKQKPKTYYNRLKKESSLFFVMSNNMKERVVNYGLPSEKVKILPIGIDASFYPSWKRRIRRDDIFNIVSVGRFVEKKGFDDLLRALAIVKEKAQRKFKCYIIGDGPLRNKLFKMTKELGLQDEVEYKGYMKIEDIIKFFKNMHLFVQPSKTAKSGDME